MAEQATGGRGAPAPRLLLWEPGSRYHQREIGGRYGLAATGPSDRLVYTVWLVDPDDRFRSTPLKAFHALDYGSAREAAEQAKSFAQAHSAGEVSGAPASE